MIGFAFSVLLVATILATSLLCLPGGVRRQVNLYEDEIMDVYLNESAIIAWTEQFPPEYFAREPWSLRLPEVQTDEGFPWMNVSAGTVVAQVGASFRTLGRDELGEVAERLESSLKREILGRGDLQVKSGNRRLTGEGKNFAMSVSAGDLTLGLNGSAGSVNLMCDGNINVGGSARYDTLRLFARGNISLMGIENVGHLEVFSGGDVELSRGVTFSGIIYSRGAISFRGNSRNGNSRKKMPSDCETSAGTPMHLISFVDSDVILPSVRERSGRVSQCLLPASVGGKMRAFSWRLQ